MGHFIPSKQRKIGLLLRRSSSLKTHGLPLRSFLMLLSVFGSMSKSRPTQLRQASLKKWLMLPESWGANAITGRAARKEAWKRFKSLSPDHPHRLGLTRRQRSQELLNAAELGNATRLELLLQAGADIEAADVYGMTSLHYAAWKGHHDAVNLLLDWGANPEGKGPGNSSPLRAAFANGHADIITTLNHSGEILLGRTMNALGDDMRSSRLETIFPVGSDHDGAGSFYIDNVFSHQFLNELVSLHDSLRKDCSIQSSPSQSSNAYRRTYFCDSEGYFSAALAAALQLYENRTDVPSLQRMCTHFRFISYEYDSSYLAPHKDFPVDFKVGKSTHTLILYLADCVQGGHTLLLDRLAKGNESMHENELGVRCAVQPLRGRLFVFPHNCPHAGREVLEGSKLILRGDAIMY